MKVQYYLVHNNDPVRRNRMEKQFKQANLKNDQVKWIIQPERHEITLDFINQYVAEGITKTNNRYIVAQQELGIGAMICTYKHYLAIQDIVINQYEYGVVMEDNMTINGDIPTTVGKYIEQLNTHYEDWDILFDNEWHDEPVRYTEQPLQEGMVVYPKSIEIGEHNHGGTKTAVFYVLNLKCAQKLYEHYIPFNNSPDWWMNDLFRKLNIKAFWSEPCIIKKWNHTSTTG
jgi:GR25 family glycosyltransferase involved in LPS biosynthesis